LDLKIGTKIKALRLASDLTQAELADRSNLTKGFISQLENDQTSIQIDSLAGLLDALGTSLADFFTDVETPIHFTPRDRVLVDGKGVSKFEILVPGSTNNQMDPIMLLLKPGESLEENEPHPGEQFGFVMQGTLTLLFGSKSYQVNKGECFYFEAEKSNQLRNDGKTSVRMMWVTTPPQM